MIGKFARHPTASNLLMAILCTMGLLALPHLQRATFPDFSASEVQIRIAYPGATSAEIEEAICQRVEDALDAVKFVEEVRSEATESMATITIEMQENANEIAAFQDEIESEVAKISDFPADVEDPIFTQLGLTDPVLVIMVAGPMSTADLKAYCEDLKRRLQRLPEVSLIKVAGFSDHQLRIDLSNAALRQYGLTAKHVAEVVRNQGVNMPAGPLEMKDHDVVLRFVEQRRTPSELESLVVSGASGGAEVLLGDLGQVVDDFEKKEEKRYLRDRRAGVLTIEKTKNQDTIRVADMVKDFIEEERIRQPKVTIEVSQDGSTLVRDRIQLVVTNAWQGLLLVFVTMWIFFNLRLSFWVVMSLPVSFLGAFYFMPMLGQTINMMTLVGMLLATGLLMDDGIVIAENIARHLSLGKSSVEAAVQGVSEVAAGVFSSFLTTVCVLGPLLSLSGLIGQVLEVIPLVLILVMAISLIEGFLILPAHLAHSLHHVDVNNPSAIRVRIDRGVDWIRESVSGRCVDLAIANRYLFVGIAIALFIISAGVVVSGRLPFQAFPDTEGDTVQARILLPQGTPLSRTETIVARITGALEELNEEYSSKKANGEELVKTYQVKFGVNIDSFESGPHVATVAADLLGAESRSISMDEFIKLWRERVGNQADTIAITYGEMGFGPAGRPIEIRFLGDDIEEIKDVARSAMAWFGNYDGVSNLLDDTRKGKVEYQIRMRDGAVGLGFNAATVASQLQAAFQGATADEIQVGSEAYEIVTRLRLEDRDSEADFRNFHLQLEDGTQVPLSTVAQIQIDRGWSRIARVNGRRAITVIGEVDSTQLNTNALIAKFRKEFVADLNASNPLVEVSIQGSTAEGNATSISMAKAFLIGLIGVFVILSFQFRSWLEPLIVMGAIPLALIGVVIGHVLFGVPLSMPSILGFVSLSGVVVNDSILLIFFLKSERGSGESAEEAARRASRIRFRAILLTSATTVAGLTPLMLERSSQAQTLVPLAISICFGLMSSTVLVLLVVPSLYVILDDFGLVAEA
jgi:HAE1 family hydrophobic/amphiphilic exporter-1